jgi:hypothetical protein
MVCVSAARSWLAKFEVDLALSRTANEPIVRVMRIGAR